MSQAPLHHALYTPSRDDRYWDAALETQSRADWDRLKLSLLQRHLHHAYQGSPYYRASFDAAGVHPDQVKNLDDLRRFPFITKHTLRERQLAVPAFGDLVAVPERDIVYISASSGSTGIPTASPFTAGDFEDWIDYEARQFWSSGMRPEDRYCHSLNMSLFIGGPCVLGAQKLGALSIHAGTVSSERLLQLLKQFQATIIWTTPSYAWYLGETAVKEGIDPKRDLAVRKIFVAGEPGGSIPETRARIEESWGADVYDYYGLSDIFGSCAGMCEEKNGLHWAEDHILVEVLDPETQELVPEGGRGEMVLTTLKKAARPMIRFRTGDIVSFTSEPCACGRTSTRLRRTRSPGRHADHQGHQHLPQRRRGHRPPGPRPDRRIPPDRRTRQPSGPADGGSRAGPWLQRHRPGPCRPFLAATSVGDRRAGRGFHPAARHPAPRHAQSQARRGSP